MMVAPDKNYFLIVVQEPNAEKELAAAAAKKAAEVTENVEAAAKQ